MIKSQSRKHHLPHALATLSLYRKQIALLRVSGTEKKFKKRDLQVNIALPLLFLLKVFKNSELYFKHLKYRQKSDLQSSHLSQKLMARYGGTVAPK